MQRYDDLLLLFMKSTDETEASRLLEQLLSHHAYPMVRRIIGSKLRIYTDELFNNNGLQDLEDVIGEVMLQLVQRLQKFKSNPDSNSFRNFRSYVAVTAYNTFHDYLRKKYPQRWRLKNKLRYILTHKENLALWENKNNDWLCGFPKWRDQKKLPCSSDQLHQLITHTELHYKQSDRNNPTRLLNSIFKLVDAPIEFDDLVNIIADLLEIREVIEEKNKDFESGLRSHLLLSSSQVSIATDVEQRMYLQRLWAEICKLPLQQRLVLLLNLRDAQGRDMMMMLAQARIATLREIAESLEMTAEEFAHLWNRLPLDDATIASQLGATRQQVINLRSSARRRLSRRMKRFEQK